VWLYWRETASAKFSEKTSSAARPTQTIARRWCYEAPPSFSPDQAMVYLGVPPRDFSKKMEDGSEPFFVPVSVVILSHSATAGLNRLISPLQCTPGLRG
jgi:hypothetical protein